MSILITQKSLSNILLISHLVFACVIIPYKVSVDFQRLNNSVIPPSQTLITPPDTITNWQVYLSDSLLIADNHFNHKSVNKLVRLHFKSIKKRDKMRIQYHTCTMYERIKKVVFIDSDRQEVFKMEFKDIVGFKPFILKYSDLKSLKGKGELSIQYNESGTSEFGGEGKTGYLDPNLELGKIIIE